MSLLHLFSFFFFFNDTATTEIYTLSLHDALPICEGSGLVQERARRGGRLAARRPQPRAARRAGRRADRKSTRLNSSHSQISYAVFCLKKKKKTSCIMLMSQCTNVTRHRRSALRNK